jgi:hypothetical protein
MVTRELSRLGRAVRRPSLPPGGDRPAPGAPRPPKPPGPDPARDEQLVRALEHQRRDRADAQARSAGARARLALDRRRSDRLREHSANAREAGDQRRAALLDARQTGLAERIAADEGLLRQTRPFGRHPAEATAAMLDEQARRPSSRERAGGRQRRDYEALAGLAGLTPTAYRESDVRAQRAARLSIDRELDRRHAVLQARAAHPPTRTAPLADEAARSPRGRASAARRPGPPRPESVVLRRERQFAGWRTAPRPTPDASRGSPRARPPD